jgi:hypothetical protein
MRGIYVMPLGTDSHRQYVISKTEQGKNIRNEILHDGKTLVEWQEKLYTHSSVAHSAVQDSHYL